MATMGVTRFKTLFINPKLYNDVITTSKCYRYRETHSPATQVRQHSTSIQIRADVTSSMSISPSESAKGFVKPYKISNSSDKTLVLSN